MTLVCPSCDEELNICDGKPITCDECGCDEINTCDDCGNLNRSKDLHEVKGGAVCDECYTGEDD